MRVFKRVLVGVDKLLVNVGDLDLVDQGLLAFYQERQLLRGLILVQNEDLLRAGVEGADDLE